MKYASTLLIGAAVFGIAAAIVWGWSAAIDLSPPSVGYGGIISPNDSFMTGMARIGRLNRWAAGLTGIAALLGGMAAAIEAWRWPLVEWQLRLRRGALLLWRDVLEWARDRLR